MKPIPWRLALATTAGLWLTVSPAVLDTPRPAATAAWVLGPLIVSVGMIAMSGITRPLRWVVAVLGVATILSAFVFPADLAAAISSIAVGTIAAFTAAREHPDPRFRGKWRALVER